MLKLIELFRKDAIGLKRNADSVEELKRWLRAEDEDEMNYDQHFGEEISSDEKGERLDKYFKIVEKYLNYITMGKKDKYFTSKELNPESISDPEVREAYEWLIANDYLYLLQERFHSELTREKAQSILDSKRAEFDSEFDSFIASIINKVPGTELIKKDEPYITNVDRSYEGGFTIRILGRLENKQNDSYTIPVVEIWSGDTDKFRYGYIGMVSEFDKEGMIELVVDHLMNPTDQNRLSIG